MEVEISIAERLKDIRNGQYNVNGKESMSQVQTACNVNDSKISGLENGTHAKLLEDFATLVKHYGVSADYVLKLSDCPSINKDVQTTSMTTGLSQHSLDNILYLKEYLPEMLDILDRLLSSKNLIYILTDLYTTTRIISEAKRVSEDDNQDYASRIAQIRAGEDSEYIKYKTMVEITEFISDALDFEGGGNNAEQKS